MKYSMIHLQQRTDSRVCRHIRKQYSTMSQRVGKAIEFVRVSIRVNRTSLPPINLSLDSSWCLISMIRHLSRLSTLRMHPRSQYCHFTRGTKLDYLSKQDNGIPYTV